MQEVYSDYPELEKYKKTIEAAATLLSDGGQEVAGEWVSQDRIRIATAGRTDVDIKGTILHELLHVDAANHLRFGSRVLYSHTVPGHNHEEIRAFTANYETYLNVGFHVSDGSAESSPPSLNSLSWRR